MVLRLAENKSAIVPPPLIRPLFFFPLPLKIMAKINIGAGKKQRRFFLYLFRAKRPGWRAKAKAKGKEIRPANIRPLFLPSVSFAAPFVSAKIIAARHETSAPIIFQRLSFYFAGSFIR